MVLDHHWRWQNNLFHSFLDGNSSLLSSATKTKRPRKRLSQQKRLRMKIQEQEKKKKQSVPSEPPAGSGRKKSVLHILRNDVHNIFVR